jgi:dienelactone hydrolase
MAPNGKYLLGMDGNWQNYVCYELSTGTYFNLTKGLPIPLIDSELDIPHNKSRGLKIAGWIRDSTSVLIYDKFDVWRLDIKGRETPINITNGYGRKNNMVFRFVKDYSVNPVAISDTVILSAFDRNNKNSGFYKVVMNKRKNPKKLVMKPCSYQWFAPSSQGLQTKQPYLVKISGANKFPNLFYTSDFESFFPLSNMYPESEYNWLSSELLNLKTLDGQLMQTILYKPENFDPNKKYPVIVHFYERKSDELNTYLRPDFTSNEINIPWFVSNGYLVLVPDIYYKIGSPGKSAYNSIISAVRYLVKMPWVDSSRLGIQGHSWGGYQTNFVIGQSSVFAAAMSSSGVSDFVSGYGSLLPNSGASKQFFFEIHQCRIGATLWQSPKLYISNSPIFFADKISTPLLMMNNKEDGVVPFAQGVEYFTALRRLRKKAWMLQYDGEQHSLHSIRASTDFTIRMTQFFDHFLKSAPVPRWMTQGIPATLKGFITGYDLDPSGNCGKDCKICKMWNEKWAKDSVATKQLIETEEKNEWMGLLDTVKPKVQKSEMKKKK